MKRCLTPYSLVGLLGDRAGLPTGLQLSQIFAQQCDYPGIDKSDFLRAAQYYELVQKEKSSQ